MTAKIDHISPTTKSQSNLVRLAWAAPLAMLASAAANLGLYHAAGS